MEIFKKHLVTICLILFCAILLVMTLRGLPGNPTPEQLLSTTWIENGPFELSPERGRFSLLYSIVEYKSFNLSEQLALFSEPDVAIKDGKYVSLFAPGVSFLLIPSYIVGKYFGASQIGVFTQIAIFALLNTFLVRKIAIKLGADSIAASLGSLTFLFATPAFAYAVSLYQHHISLFILLLIIYIYFSWKNILAVLIIGFLWGFSLLIDYPNTFFIFPVVVYAMTRFISIAQRKNELIVRIWPLGSLFLFAAVIPVLFLLWFNNTSYGDPLQISGTLERSIELQQNILTPKEDESLISKQEVYLREKLGLNGKNIFRFFQSRDILHGFYIHSFSPDRGVIYYAPVILLGFWGMIKAYKKKTMYVPLFITLVGANVLLYSMWGDPWGGWAFGSRYLIPSYAILAIFLAYVLTQFRKNTFIILLFGLLFCYSVTVNTAGALTSSKNPPQVEVLNLEKISGKEEKYTYQRNLDLLDKNKSKSYLYQTIFSKYLSAKEYYYLVVALIFIFGVSMTLMLIFTKKDVR